MKERGSAADRRAPVMRTITFNVNILKNNNKNKTFLHYLGYAFFCLCEFICRLSRLIRLKWAGFLYARNALWSERAEHLATGAIEFCINTKKALCQRLLGLYFIKIKSGERRLVLRKYACNAQQDPAGSCPCFLNRQDVCCQGWIYRFRP